MAAIVFPTAPGTIVNVTSVQGGAGDPAPNATAFVIGIADRGPVVPTRVADLLDYANKFGGRSSSAGILSDSIETIFGEGGYSVYVSRVVGPTPTVGTLTLMDRAGSPLATVRLDAAWVGTASTQIAVQVTAAASGLSNAIDILIYDSNSSQPNSPVEYYRDLTAVSGLTGVVATINQSSSLVVATDLASASSGFTAMPAVVAKTALSAGTDDRTNIGDTNWETAAASFGPDLGPGLMLAPGNSTSAVQLNLQLNAASNGRFCLLDTVATPTASGVTTQAAAQAAGTGMSNPGDSAMLCTPWVTISPSAGTSVPRPVPASAFYAGIIARNDGATGHSNQAAMGAFGAAEYASGIYGGKFSEADRTTINGRIGTTGASVITARPDSPVESFGFRTVSTVPNSYFAANIRQTLLIKSKLQAMGDKFIGRQIDGRGLLFADVAANITDLMLTYYNANALYGATPANAFGVDVGPTVNTPSTISQGLIKATVWFIPSPTGERVVFNLIRQGVAN